MTTKHDKPITTNNYAWGFFGTFRHITEKSEQEAAEAFDLMARALMGAYGIDADTARDFLDGRPGRHLADAVVDETGRIGTPPKWLGREIERWTR